jgi:hypothetical protein
MGGEHGCEGQAHSPTEVHMTRASWAEDDGTVTVFMCARSWEHEIGGASGGERVFPSVEDLKEHSKCWEGCGIVELKVSFVKTVLKVTEP